MTEKDAIEILKNIQNNLEETLFLDRCAIDMAIDALEEQRPHGEWIYEYDDFYHCSICGDVICTQWDELSLKKYFPFCHCGAEMRKEGEKE